MTVDSHREAELDFVDAVQYYNHKVKGLGIEFFNEVHSSFHLITSLPDSGSPSMFGTRKTRINRFPFELIYHKSDGLIVILAVKHFKRRPGYWMERKQ